MATFIVNVNSTPDPEVVTIKVIVGLSVTEFYDAPASVLTDNTLILNIVKLSKLGVGLVPIKPK